MSYRKEVIGDCELYLADCQDVVSHIGFCDAIVTDPPYKFKTSGGGKMRKERKCLEDIIEHDLDKGFDLKIINPLLYGSAVVFCHNDQLPSVLPYMAGSYSGFALLGWQKNNPPPFRNKSYLPDLEPYIHAWNKGHHPVGKHEDMRHIFTGNNGKSEYDHPTVKPLDLMNKIMRNVNGNTVIDPFMGTGTTGVVAIGHGKKFFGVEKIEKFFDIACFRIEKALNDKKSY